MYVSGSHPIRLQLRVADPSGSLTEATMLGGSALSIAEHSIWVRCCGLPSNVRVYAVTQNTAGSPGTLRSGRPLHHHYTDRFQKILVTSATCIALGHQSHGRVVEDRILWTCTLEERAVRWETRTSRKPQLHLRLSQKQRSISFQCQLPHLARRGLEGPLQRLFRVSCLSPNICLAVGIQSVGFIPH